MSEGFSFDVFLSHSSKDKAVVRDVAERLHKDGLKVWFDEWVLKPGDSIPAKIESGLESSRVLVLCMSAHAFGSDWRQLKAGTFRFRDPLNQERRFIPLRLDDAPIKGSLAQFLYINWHPAEREQEYRKLLDSCQPLVKTKPPKRTSVLRLSAANAVRLTPKARIKACPFSPSRKFALTGSFDAALQLWDLETGQCLQTLKGHTDKVMCTAWSPDGLRAISGSYDNTIRLSV